MSRLRVHAVSIATLVFAIAILSIAHPLQAQVLYGSIVGSVVDAAHASVPGAKVKVTSPTTGQSRESVTDAAGTYTFASLPADTYDVSISAQGFQLFKVNSVLVAADSRIRVDAALKVGAVEQTVEVSAQAASLQTDSGEVRSEITTQSLQNVPIPVGRNYQNLLITVPGVSPPSNAHSVSANPSRGLNFNVNGATRNSNNVRIDGALANNVWLPHVTAYVPALDAIEQVSVVTASADAQQAMAGGSAINVQIKSGTNQVHGSLYEFHANSHIKANPFFLPAGQGKPKYIDNQFGGSVGGPIRRNKLFYFGSWEGTYNRQTGASFATVPTAAIRSGNMSGSPNPIYDPATGSADGSGRTAFPGNIIPANRQDPIAQMVGAAFPQPTYPDQLTNNVYATGAYSVTRPKFDTKVNWVASNKLNISGRLGLLHFSMIDPPLLGDGGGGPVASAGGRAGTASGNVYSMTYSANYVVKPNLVVDGYFGYTRNDTVHNPVRQDEPIGTKTLGLPGTNLTPEAGGWPDFQFSTFTELGTPGGSSALRYNDRSWEYTANASWTRSAHNFRFGVDVSKYSINHYEATSAMGVFNFAGGVTTLRGGPSPNQYNSYAQFLLGQTSFVQSGIHPFDGNRLTSRQKSYSFFGQDQWQVSPHLTASLGIRWDFFPMGTRQSRGMERYNFDTNQMSICGVASVPTDCGYHIEQKNFSPRVGIAWRPSDTTVIRSGFGLNYDPYPLAFVRNMLTNYPNDLLFTINQTSTQTAATQLKAGIPAINVPDITSGLVTVPAAYAVRSLPQNTVRGYIMSWNLSVQKQLPGALIGQASYVGSRQIKIVQRFDLNAGQIPGAGVAGQPFFAKFGRTTATELLTPIGRNNYDSLQATLQRRMAHGVTVNLAYTWSKVIGICCDDLSDGYPRVLALQYMALNRAIMPYDRTHNFTTSFVAEFPFGKGKKWASSGAAAKLLGGWQVNGLLASYSGLPFSVSAAGTSLNLPAKYAACQSGEVECRDPGRGRAESVVLRSAGVCGGDDTDVRQRRI